MCDGEVGVEEDDEFVAPGEHGRQDVRFYPGVAVLGDGVGVDELVVVAVDFCCTTRISPVQFFWYS